MVFCFRSQFAKSKSSNDTLPTPFKFLYDSDCSFQISVKSDSISNNLDFLSDSQILLDSFYNLIPWSGIKKMTR